MTLSPEVLSGLRERLEPCPFCGGAVELTSSKTLGDRLFCIKCPDDSPCVGSGLGIYVVAGQVETAIAAWNRRAALDLSPPVVEEGEPLKRYDIEPWQDENGFMFIERSENPAGAWMLAEDVLSASPVPEPQAVAWRDETEAEHISRDIKEGRFPARSEKQQRPAIADAWERMRDDSELDAARRKLSMHELRRIIKHAVDAHVELAAAAPLSGGDGKVTDEAIDRAIKAYCDEPSNDMRDMMRAALSTMGGKP